jgi:hypothetical protein
MNNLQSGHLDRTEQRLGEILIKAERRASRYENNQPLNLEHKLDDAMIQHLTVALQNIRDFRKFEISDQIAKTEEKPTAYLKDAVLELHELSAYMLKNLEDTSPFMKKIYENEDRWLRMITISMVGLLINICADNIRMGLAEVERKMTRLSNTTNSSAASGEKKPFLRVVK